ARNVNAFKKRLTLYTLLYYNLAYTFDRTQYREIDVTETARAIRGAEIFAALKHRIIRWEYPPGYRFTEEEICKEFGVSRSPVRETLRMLEEHGLVEKVPYRGCTVKQPDVQAINELYDVRAILETQVGELMANTTTT